MFPTVVCLDLLVMRDADLHLLARSGWAEKVVLRAWGR
jgi:hypothetical protein